MTELTSRQTAPFLQDLHFGESPRWHDGRLWFADFYQSAVLSAGESGDVRVEVVVPGEPGGFGWMPDGRLLASTRKPRTVVRLEPDGTLVEHGDLKPTATFYGNDMVVDASGRAYVGNFGFDFDAFVEEHGELALVEGPGAPRTQLVRIDPQGSAHVATDDLYFPNGSVITPDGRTFIVAETLAGQLTAYEIDEDGNLSGRRVWAPLSWCAPDGICLDAEGRIWVANAMTAECQLVAEGGEVVDRVITSQNCYACMLGGSDRRTLYLMTAPTSAEAVVRATRAGRIEQIRVAVPGAGLP
jgi:sugar lactone lactonase YvrE